MKKIVCATFGILSIIIAHPQSTNIDKNRVMEFFQNQQYDEAINYLMPLASHDSNNIQLLHYLGYANYMNDDMKSAEKYYQTIFNIDSNNIAANQYLLSIISNRSSDEAMPFALRLVKIEPNRSANNRNLASLFQRKNRNDSAIKYFTTAYQLSPKDQKNITGLANVLIEEKQYPQADSIIQIALSKDSLNPVYLKLRILSAYNAKDYQHVLDPGEKLLHTGELSLGSLSKLVISYYRMNLFNDCIRVCEYLQSNELANEDIYYYEAKSQANLNHLEESNQLFQKCLSLAISKNAELYYYNLASNFEALKKFKVSLSQYDTGYYLFKNPLMLYNMGRLYEIKLNNISLARKYYQRYLATSKPELADEKKAYQYVKEKWGRKAAKK